MVITKTGSGTGTVTSSPAGIDCGEGCSKFFSPGTQVTLSAAADPSSAFFGWSGEGCSGTEICMVTMDAPKNITAYFRSHLCDAILTLQVVSGMMPIDIFPIFDVNGDGKIGMAEAICNIQKAAGLH